MTWNDLPAPNRAAPVRGDETASDRSGRRLTVAGVVLGLVAATGFGLLIQINATPPERGLESLSFPLLWAMPGLLGTLSLRARPVLLIPAAALGVLLSLTSFSGVTLVLIIPAVCFIFAYRRRTDVRVSVFRSSLALFLPMAATGSALVILLTGPDPACWTYLEHATGEQTYTEVTCDEGPLASGSATTPAQPGTDTGSGSGSGSPPPPTGSTGSESAVVSSGGGSTSDTITAFEALATAALATTGLGAAWTLARPPS